MIPTIHFRGLSSLATNRTTQFPPIDQFTELALTLFSGSCPPFSRAVQIAIVLMILIQNHLLLYIYIQFFYVYSTFLCLFKITWSPPVQAPLYSWKVTLKLKAYFCLPLFSEQLIYSIIIRGCPSITQYGTGGGVFLIYYNITRGGGVSPICYNIR